MTIKNEDPLLTLAFNRHLIKYLEETLAERSEQLNSMALSSLFSSDVPRKALMLYGVVNYLSALLEELESFRRSINE
jgi:hypothetical protein